MLELHYIVNFFDSGIEFSIISVLLDIAVDIL